MKAESITKVSNFYILVQVYYCCFSNKYLRQAHYTMKAESITKVNIFYILVQVYYCCFSNKYLRQAHYTVKAESITKVCFTYWYKCIVVVLHIDVQYV